MARAIPVSINEEGAAPAGGAAAGTAPAAADQTPVSPQVSTPAPDALEPGSVIRRAVVKPADKMEVIYALTATQPFDSKLTGQTIRFSIQENGAREVTLADGKTVQQLINSTNTTSINTGKTKTVAQLRDTIKDVFQHFLNDTTTPGQDLGKVGDARYGGELHFIAEDANTLRFDYVPNDKTFRFKRPDVQKFAELLAQ